MKKGSGITQHMWNCSSLQYVVFRFQSCTIYSIEIYKQRVIIKWDRHGPLHKDIKIYTKSMMVQSVQVQRLTSQRLLHQHSLLQKKCQLRNNPKDSEE